MSQDRGRRLTRFCREWTTLELATVRRLAGKVNAEAIGKAVNRTPDAVRKFARCNAWFEGESLSDADKLSCPDEVEDWRRRMRLALAQPELLKWLGRAER